MHLLRAVIIYHRAWFVFVVGLSLADCSTPNAVVINLPKAPASLLPGIPTTNGRLLRSEDNERPQRIKRLSIGLGSGLHGFVSVELQADGRVTVVLDDPSAAQRFIEVSSAIAAHEARDLLKSDSISACLTLGDQYSTGLHDGTQGFLFVQDQHGTAFTFYDNAFPSAFQKAWDEVKTFVEQHPHFRWKCKGQTDGFRVYRQAKAAARESKAE